MTPHTLQQKLTALLQSDSRPPSQQNPFQRKHHLKRTHIESVKVLPAGSPPSAPPTKQLLQTSIAHAGTTSLGTLTRGPLNPAAINQHLLSDCWLLAAILLVTFHDPAFFDDLIVPVGNNQVVVQLYSDGLIVQILTSLLVSTDYDRPDDGDVRPELLEKTYSLFRAGVSDYLQDNMGLTSAALASFGLASFGLDTTIIPANADAILPLLAAGKVVALQTHPAAPSPWVQDHFYAVRAADPANRLILRNPWAGAADLEPLPPAILDNPAIFTVAHVGSFPPTKKLLAAYVTIPPTTTASLQPAIQPPQEKKMTTTLSTSQPVTLPIASATLFDCRTETQGGRPDIGFLLADGYTEQSLLVPAPPLYTLTISVAAPAPGAFIISINGSILSTTPFPATGSWSTFTNLSATLTLPAGPVTLRIAPTPNSQYNLADLTLTPILQKQIKSLAIDFTTRTTTALYQDGTTATLT